MADIKNIVDLNTVEPAALTELIGEAFQLDTSVFGYSEDGTPAPTEIYYSYGEVELKLLEVAERSPVAGSRQPFSILFSGSTSTMLHAGVHLVTNEKLGSIFIFLTPITGHGISDLDADNVVYESVFS